jgi:tRNA-specific 2-thiouridylase
MTKHRIVVGLSGGVDSAVTAHLLKQQGHEVVGIFMKNWEDDDDSEYCSTRQDFLDAASVADVLGIEIEHVNFAADYKDRVFAEFLREYQAGRTPNPDVLCNAEIKFKAFLDHAMRLGAEKIATGHYARVRLNEATGLHELLKGVDETKDQSYFLHRLTPAQLAKAMFPVGELRKTQVREIAAGIALPNAKKKDSTGICFIGERPFREFLNRYIQSKPGDIVDDRGQRIGQHVGLSFYTLGQRQGLGIGGVKHAGEAAGGGEHAPWFVARKDMAHNRLWAVQGHEHPWLLSPELRAQDLSWCAGTAPAPGRYTAKTRYRQQDAACTLRYDEAGRLLLAFDEAQWAVTPGQSAVLYDGEVCLGGGVIDHATALNHALPEVATPRAKRKTGGRFAGKASAGSQGKSKNAGQSADNGAGKGVGAQHAQTGSSQFTGSTQPKRLKNKRELPDTAETHPSDAAAATQPKAALLR